MDDLSQVQDEKVTQRLSRFAQCVASSADVAFSVISSLDETTASQSDLHSAFRALVDRLDPLEPAGLQLGRPAGPAGERFRRLGYHHRTAFALVAIEEFSISDAALIMGLEHGDVLALLVATREFLFTMRGPNFADA